MCHEPHIRPLCQWCKQQARQFCIRLQLTWGGGELQNKTQKVKRELATILEACLLHKNNSEVLLLPPFLNKQPCTLTWLASWLLQNYFTANLTAESRLSFSFQEKSLKETICQGLLTHPRSHPPEQQPSLGRILSGFSRHRDCAVKPLLPKGSS